jgi:methyltransferase (TIGR00027 family)
VAFSVDQTALGPMIIVAAEQYESAPIVRDPWAGRILPPAGRIAAMLARWAPARRAMISATEKKIPGGWASLVCRKRHIDDLLLDAVTKGVDAVVILGAGFDTRKVRLPSMTGIPVCEVDLPANITRKTAALRRCFGRIPTRLTLLPVDFQTDNLRERLRENGFEPGMRMFVIWEAVTMYLFESSVRQTLHYLNDAAPGSHLALTYIRKDFLDGSAAFGARVAYEEFVIKRRLWRFGLNPEQVNGFLADYGWREVEQAGPEEYAKRYLQPAGRSSTVSEIERAVYAVR